MSAFVTDPYSTRLLRRAPPVILPPGVPHLAMSPQIWLCPHNSLLMHIHHACRECFRYRSILNKLAKKSSPCYPHSRCTPSGCVPTGLAVPKQLVGDSYPPRLP